MKPRPNHRISVYRTQKNRLDSGLLFRFYFFFLISFLSINVRAQSSCIVINEVMVNPALSCDGSCSPHTSEWVELYNTCDVPVDIGCFVLGDGDFSVRIPQGTTLGPHAFFIIGSDNSGGPVDIDISSCGCTTGSGIGIFSNDAEQVVLLNSQAQIVDALYWNGGQIPLSIVSPGQGVCTGMSKYISSTAGMETVLSSGGNGCSISRVCDGASTWVERCGNFTMGSSNGVPPEPSFIPAESVICTESCIDFTSTSVGNPSSWNWSFPGSSEPVSSDENPQGICYPTPGVFDVSLTVTNTCGSYNVVYEDAVTVGQIQAPVILQDGPVNICLGQIAELSVEANYNSYQWLWNGQAVPGAEDPEFIPFQSGTYSVRVTQGLCEAVSNLIVVNIQSPPSPIVTTNGEAGFCPGESITLTATPGFSAYQWFFNNNLVAGGNSSSLVVNNAGAYSVSVSNGVCVAVSPAFTVQGFSPPPAEVNASPDLILCQGESVILSAPSGLNSYTWFLSGSQSPLGFESSIEVEVSGEYFVVVENAECQSESGLVEVEVKALPAPVISPSSSLIICENSTGVLNAAGSGSFQWILGNSEIPGATGNSLIVANAGQYAVRLTDEWGCVGISPPVNVTVEAPPNLNIVSSLGDYSACQNAGMELSVPGNWTGYVWTLNGSFLTSSLSVQPALSGSYSVSVTSLAGCIANTSVDVVLYPLPVPVLQVLGASTVCSGEWVTLQTSEWSTYSWSRNGVFIPDAFTATLQGQLSGSYTVTVTDENGCEGTSVPVPVVIRPVVDPGLTVSSQIACEGDKIILGLSGSFEEILWSDGSSGSSIIATSSGSYGVYVVDEWGCEGSESVDLHFNSMPVAVAGDNLEGNCDNGVMIGLIAEGGTVSWTPSQGLSDAGVAQPWARPDVTTTYTLTVENGPCIASDKVTVYADCFSFFAPNSFTPNGDGLNDAFMVTADGVEEFRMVILDRWGNQVFAADDPDMVWTGGFQSGDYYAPDGVYVWRAVIRFYGRSDAEVFTGHVNIIR